MWLVDAFDRISLVVGKGNKEENEAIINAYNNLETINTLLYQQENINTNKDGKVKQRAKVDNDVKNNVASKRTKAGVQSAIESQETRNEGQQQVAREDKKVEKLPALESKQPPLPTTEESKQESLPIEEVVSENPALRDVESTAKALANVDLSKLSSEKRIMNELSNNNFVIDGNNPKSKSGKQLPKLPKYSIRGDAKKMAEWLVNSAKIEAGNDRYLNTLINAEEKSITKNGLPEASASSLNEIIFGNPYPQISYKTETQESISEAYHKAKADGSNPKLVKSVEDLLSNNVPTPISQNSPTTQPQSRIEQSITDSTRMPTEEQKELVRQLLVLEDIEDATKEMVAKEYERIFNRHSVDDITTTLPALESVYVSIGEAPVREPNIIEVQEQLEDVSIEVEVTEKTVKKTFEEQSLDKLSEILKDSNSIEDYNKKVKAERGKQGSGMKGDFMDISSTFNNVVDVMNKLLKNVDNPFFVELNKSKQNNRLPNFLQETIFQGQEALIEKMLEKGVIDQVQEFKKKTEVKKKDIKFQKSKELSDEDFIRLIEDNGIVEFDEMCGM